MDSNHMTAPVNFPQLAVVIPALNEKENLDLLLPALKEVVVGMGVTAEIVVVDGGSRDGTREAAVSWLSAFGLPVLRYWTAVMQGFVR